MSRKKECNKSITFALSIDKYKILEVFAKKNQATVEDVAQLLVEGSIQELDRCGND